MSSLILFLPQMARTASIGLGRVKADKSREEAILRGQRNSLSDFDGDGFSDLSVGAPGAEVSGKSQAGAVYIFDGSPSGLAAAPAQVWTQETLGIHEEAEAFDRFGFTLSSNDFNDDGYGDLAIGVPYEDEMGGSLPDTGIVHVLYGSPAGLTSLNSQLWSGPSISPERTDDGGELFGWALAAANLGRGREADLAVSSPNEDVEGVEAGGTVHVIYGSHLGLSSSNTQSLNPGMTGVRGRPRSSGRFGYALSAGDHGRSGEADLAVGSPFHCKSRGMVSILYGSESGITTEGDQILRRTSLGASNRTNDIFGYSLVSGDFGRSGHHDLAIGAPGAGSAGIVHVVYGAKRGLKRLVSETWTSEDAGGSPRKLQYFGGSLAAGDLGQGNRDDLAVGASADTVRDVRYAGSVAVIYGGRNGLVSGSAQRWKPPMVGVKPREGDFFGHSLAVADFGNGRAADLAIGILFYDSSASENTGAAQLLYGSADGLSADNAHLIRGGSNNHLESREAWFGIALSASTLSSQ